MIVMVKQFGIGQQSGEFIEGGDFGRAGAG